MLRDIDRGDDPQLGSARAVLRDLDADILVLSGVDTDALGRTFDRLAEGISEEYVHRFTKVGNEGRATGLDLNGDGVLYGAEDAHGFGEFPGHQGLGVLAKRDYPLQLVTDFSGVLWRELPGALLGGAGLADEVQGIHRLSSTSHWVISAGPVHLLIHSGTPPVFDGPEDRNGRRNHDEAAFWLAYFKGTFGKVPDGPLVLMAKVNADPNDGDGRPEAIRALLAHPRLQDPKPRSMGAASEATPGHLGDPALDTANWDEPEPGNLRADYILPSRELEVVDAGVMWPSSGSAVAEVSRHGVVWVDLRLPRP